MSVERDLAGIAFPFAAGVIATTYISDLPFRAIAVSSSAVSIITSFLAIVLIHPRRKSLHPAFSKYIAAATALFCGLLTGLTDLLISLSSIDTPCRIEASVVNICRELQAEIDSIPFRNQETSALIKALITGDRSEIPQNVTNAFRRSGASHVLALSGLHLGIIYVIVNKLMNIIGKSPAASFVRSVAIVIFCGLYTLATGASPSTVRALIFIAIGEAARITGRYRGIGNTLLAALTIQAFFSPSSIGTVSFQLSYAAMAGIAFIFPQIRNFWPKDSHGLLRRIWDSAAMSISCQLTTGPLAYIYFETFPPHFLLTNLLAIPLTSLIIPATLFILCLSALDICPQIAVRATEALVTALSEALHIIASM